MNQNLHEFVYLLYCIRTRLYEESLYDTSHTSFELWNKLYKTVVWQTILKCSDNQKQEFPTAALFYLEGGSTSIKA
jgi:hypothetical protein